MDTEKVPAWLQKREPYEPPLDRSRYLEKSLRALISALAALKERPGSSRENEVVAPALKLLSTLLLILLLSLSRASLFLEIAAALEFACLCLLPAGLIARALKKTLVAGLFALVIFLPALLLGRGANLLPLCLKVLLAVLAASIFSATTPWPSVTAAFSSLRVPDLFVMTLDLTIKYISLLGGLVLNLLQAQKLRSVGRDPAPMRSLAGIAGTLFLKSKEAAQDQYQAMACRCFDGSYRRRPRGRADWRSLAFASLDLALLAAFFVFGARP